MVENNVLKAYTLFAGVIGLHLGLENAGVQVLVASDISDYAEKTHKKIGQIYPLLKV